jgi:uncharacterized protein YfdQ (DUF2303 family)
MEYDQNNIQSAIEAGKSIGATKTINIKGVPFLIMSDGISAISKEHLLPNPTRIKRRATADTQESFCNYLNHFSDDRTAIFCDRDIGKFTAIIDFDTPETPAWGDHSITFRAKLTKEASSWLTTSGTAMTQEQFALFIEENAEEITAPPAAEMLEIALNLKTKTNITFTSAKRLSNGQTQLEYTEEIQGSTGHKGEISIPETFSLGMRIYEGGDAYQLEAHFRYRIKDGNAVMWFDLIRPHKVKQAAIEDIYKYIQSNTTPSLLINGEP